MKTDVCIQVDVREKDANKVYGILSRMRDQLEEENFIVQMYFDEHNDDDEIGFKD